MKRAEKKTMSLYYNVRLHNKNNTKIHHVLYNKRTPEQHKKQQREHQYI